MSSTYEGFTAEERAAMKDHAQEMKKASRRGSRADKAAEAERDVLAKIAEMGDSDRIMAERVHTVITAGAPALAPKLWYGMPAYALNGKVVCFFKPAEKFKARYATLGFSDQAKLDDGPMWAAEFALTEVTPEVEERIGALVKQALS
ncbi:iron chaperone [Actinoallomurus acaciae]|uniref:Iron chaperone n=1 Tax=Actinoallomurus acaciae TaxID=502577 RepID=A0ABV5YU18_9ACTN